MAQERKNPGGGQQTPQFEERSLRKPKQLEFTRQTIRGKNSCKERKLWRHAEGIPQEIS